MNFPDQNTNGNKSSRSMSPSRNREIEVAQAGLRRSYMKDHAVNENSRQPSRNFLQVLAQLFINLTRM